MQITNEDEIERSNGEFLASMGIVDVETAIRVLRKHNGNMEKAADAILAGDSVQDEGLNIWKTTTVTQHSERRNVTPEPTASSQPPVIDLTEDDDAEMNRAIKMSMSQSLPEFKPSERAPNPEWAMVRADVIRLLILPSSISHNNELGAGGSDGNTRRPQSERSHSG